jgi:hypothetical protein
MKIDNLLLECWFPTVIGTIDCPFFANKKESLIKYIDSIKTKEGFNYYQLHKDNNLKQINNWIEKEVNNYAKLHNFFYQYEAKESWFIDYEKYMSNEWHSHSGFTISVVFILESTSDVFCTRFRNPIFADPKNPQNNKVDEDYKQQTFNTYTFPLCSYPSVPGRLLIFRSHILHCSDAVNTDDRRLIFSYNFDPK